MKGQIWISAVLYTALGIIIITLILNAGLPLINKIKDRNLVSQTKIIMHAIDDNIRKVASEGPGSKRFLSPVSIEGGELIIEDSDDKILWRLKTPNKFAEPDIIFDEGQLRVFVNETDVEGNYVSNLELSYGEFADIKLISDLQNPFIGEYSFSIEHDGTYTDSKPVITIAIR